VGDLALVDARTGEALVGTTTSDEVCHHDQNYRVISVTDLSVHIMLRTDYELNRNVRGSQSLIRF
jgi:hypothetical protein